MIILFLILFYMVSIQYVGDSHTSVFIPREPQKVRVVNGEIIDIADEKIAKSLLYRGFQLIDDVPAEKEETVDNVPAEAVSVEIEDDGKDEVTIEVASKKKSK